MTLRVRAVDADGDMTFGRGGGSFLVDSSAAVAQIVVSRLNLWLGEWYLDPTDGTRWQTNVLGKYTGSTRDAEVRARMLGTPYLTAIVSYSSQVNRQTRAYAVQATAETAFGLAPLAAAL